MADTPFQPTLPAEGYFSEAELSFLEDSPPGLFPDNQDSNFGFIIRKLFSDQIQILADQLLQLWNERFIDTSNDYLGIWESELGLPSNPVGKSIDERRNLAYQRFHKGAFTRTVRWNIVKGFIYMPPGPVIELIPQGVPFTTDGLELHDEFQDSTVEDGTELVPGGVPFTTDGISLGGDVGLFNIIEHVDNFSYDVRIRTTVTPDLVSMTRELERITPAHITFTITSTDDLYG